MLTPAGAECALYYEDFQRGAARQECRAAKGPRSAEWRPSDCKACPVPSILEANGSTTLELRITIHSRARVLRRRITVEAWCSEHGPMAGDPKTGCVECNAEADELLRRAFD